MIKVEPNEVQIIKSFLSEKGLQQTIRIDLHFSGCCDPSLLLRADTVSESDLTQVVDGLTFIIDPETYQLVGEVMITYVNEVGKKGFVLSSSNPVSEWEGFYATDIKI
jgi:Fe-S cluster assembly iron-binding protein IscA